MNEVLSREYLANCLDDICDFVDCGWSKKQANRIEASHEALRERAERAEAELQDLRDKRVAENYALINLFSGGR